MFRSLLNILKRPSLWTAVIAIVAYWDPKALRGAFVYDDSGSVFKNVVVNGHVPWKEAFTRDFWGTPMKEPASHKSFRPITTLSFKLNWLLSEQLGTSENMDETTHYYHIVNVVLHGVNTGLVTEAASFIFDDISRIIGNSEADILAQLITGFLFALHPVHAEAVSNITSRGELLMTLFFLIAFLSYAGNTPQNIAREIQIANSYFGTLHYLSCVYVIPWVCMALSLFSKEQGATTLCTLVLYDFIKNHGSVKDFVLKLVQERERYSLCFLGRTIILAIQTLLLVALRYWLNGETSPDFIYDQNPAGFSEDRFARVLSVSWVYCLYIRDAVWPYYLSPDWSGKSIDLIEDISDRRGLMVIFLWIFAFACLQSLFHGLPSHATKQESEFRQVVLMAFFAFLFLPFLLSSNLLVVVGLMKADRVIYLPLFGFCVMEALLIKAICCSVEECEYKLRGDDDITIINAQKGKSSKKENSGKKGLSAATQQQEPKLIATTTRLRVNFLGHLLVIMQLGMFVVKLHERNIAWSNPELLWVSAFNINPRSHHTMYNCGYELSLRQRYEEAEKVMRPIGNARVDGPSNTFVYAIRTLRSTYRISPNCTGSTWLIGA